MVIKTGRWCQLPSGVINSNNLDRSLLTWLWVWLIFHGWPNSPACGSLLEILSRICHKSEKEIKEEHEVGWGRKGQGWGGVVWGEENVTKMYCLCNCYGHKRGVWSYIHNSLSTDFWKWNASCIIGPPSKDIGWRMWPMSISFMFGYLNHFLPKTVPCIAFKPKF